MKPTTLISQVKTALTSGSAMAAALEAANGQVALLTTSVTTLTGERDTALAQVASLTTEKAAALQKITDLTASQADFDQRLAAAVADRIALSGFPADQLPAPADKPAASSEEDMIAAIDAEKDPVKRSALFATYEKKFL
ncbi:MAG: hypothetical protein B9S32_13895 [Verrucomicrobia bacterium Tous-C9LFEB]|nr:MAG: hypothetical protein B9S32_13895 [Verrucomicrobia bacterium Tous-C9LFEB]